MATEDDLELDTDEQGGKGAGLPVKKLLIWGGGGLLAIMLLVGISVTTTLMLLPDKSHDVAAGESTDEESGDHKAEKTSGKKEGKKGKKGKKEIIYHPLKPPFVVNFSGPAGVRYLQIDMEVSAHNQEAIDSVEKHKPVIRNNILLLLGAQTYDSISSREGKDKLRADVLAEIQKILKENTGKPGVDDVYFTSLVMQ